MPFAVQLDPALQSGALGPHGLPIAHRELGTHYLADQGRFHFPDLAQVLMQIPEQPFRPFSLGHICQIGYQFQAVRLHGFHDFAT
jgi:hypothetical protein